jgi:hypothetical protein
MEKMGLVNWMHMELIDPVLRELAYRVAMIIYYIIAWHPEFLDKTDVKTVVLFAKATKRNNEVSDYYIKIAKMRGFNIE